MSRQYMRVNDTPEKAQLRKKALPSEPLINSILLPAITELLQGVLITTLKAEIEIYKAFPKGNGKMCSKTFDPRNHKTCFMGQGFMVQNSDWGDADLSEYRRGVGTIHHGEWGNCTLLEAWAGDHFEKWPKMVKGVFKYCNGERKVLPIIKFYINPLFKNPDSGLTVPDIADKELSKAQYLIEVNGLRAEWDMDPLKVLEGEYLKDFEAQWEEKYGNQ